MRCPKDRPCAGPVPRLPTAILFRAGGLGDLLVALPSIGLVRKRLRGFSLTLAGRREYAGLLVRAGVVDTGLDFDDRGLAPFFATAGPFGTGHVRGRMACGSGDGGSAPEAEPRSESILPGGFALAVGWFNGKGNRSPDRGAPLAGAAAVRSFFVSYDDGSGRPLSRFFFDRTRALIEEACGSDGGDDPGLFESCARLPVESGWIEKAMTAAGVPAGESGRRRLIIHPGSGGRVKRWPLENFIEMAGRAASAGLGGIFVTGEAEEDLEARLAGCTLPTGWSRLGRPTVEVLAGLLAASRLYLGNDSGPTHLAAACGARVVALFRESLEPAWRPFGRTTVIAAPDVESIDPEIVFGALQAASRDRAP